MIGVAWYGSRDQMQAFVDRHGLTMPTVDDAAQGAVFARFGIGYQPAWAFIDADGEVSTHLGALDTAGIERALGAALRG